MVNSTPTNPSGGRWSRRFDAAVQRWPFVAVFLVIFASNIVGSVFNIDYNRQLIVERLMDAGQQHVFSNIAFPVYNALAYTLGIGLTLWLLVPLSRCRTKLRAGMTLPPAKLEAARKRLVNLPFYQVCINFLGWLPGAIFFPLLICGLGSSHEAALIWLQFVLSFLISALLTTAQTFFLLEWFLIRYFYADFFQDARPAAVHGAIRIPFGWRLTLLWSAVAVPLLALLLVALNIRADGPDTEKLKSLATLVTVIGGLSGAFIFWLVGSDLSKWVRAHATATEQIELDNYDVPHPGARPARRVGTSLS